MRCRHGSAAIGVPAVPNKEMEPTKPPARLRGSFLARYAAVDDRALSRMRMPIMAKYKVLKSVAHSFGHSFVSLMNYREDDYVMGHLLTQARSTRQPSLIVDILRGTAAPASLLTRPIAASVSSYCAWFPDLVARHRTELQYVRSAGMEVTFDLLVERPVRGMSHLIESPFLCCVTIEDDRGKQWTAEIRDWWFPEATGPTGPAAKRRPRFIRRLLGKLRGWGGFHPKGQLRAAA